MEKSPNTQNLFFETETCGDLVDGDPVSEQQFSFEDFEELNDEQQFDEEDVEELNKIIILVKNSSNHEHVSEVLTSSNHSDPKDGGRKENDESKFGYSEFNSIISKEFSTREDLISCVRDVASKLGYATNIKKSKKDCYVFIGCDRGGVYRSRGKMNKRTTATRLINCPFEIKGKKGKKKDLWSLEIRNLSHNHEPSTDLSGHPLQRRFSSEETEKIKEMTMAGITPRQILTSLRGINPNLQATARNVYNARAKIREERLLGRTMIEALVEELGTGGFTYDINRDDDGHLTHLFFAHPSTIALTRSYPTIFLMDCTYKTNKYKMPLLNIVGVTSFGTTFFSCFAFLQKVEEYDYMWALENFKKVLGPILQPACILTDRELALINAIGVLFPRSSHLLCVWHIEKNILAKCKGQFSTEKEWKEFSKDWIDVIKSDDIPSFEEAWSDFEYRYKEKLKVLHYIKTRWLPLKEKFVYAWTEDILHFGNNVTSRVEGAHSKLKKYLQVSIGDLHGVKDKICHAIETEFHEIKAQLSSEKIRIPHKFRITLFEDIIGHVSVYALGELFQQYELATLNGFLDSCRCHFSNSMGLPCAHKIQKKIVQNQKLQLTDIHPQWRLDVRSFTILEVSSQDYECQISSLLKKVHDDYQKMSLEQKEDTCKQILRIVDAPRPFTLQPKVVPHKGRPRGTKKQRKDHSTTRNPSEFEIVERALKHSRRA